MNTPRWHRFLLYTTLALPFGSAHALDWDKLQQKVEEQLGLRTKDDKDTMLNGGVQATPAPARDVRKAAAAPAVGDMDFPLPPPRDVVPPPSPVAPHVSQIPTAVATAPAAPATPPEKGGDQTLVLLANLIERQDALEKRLRQIDENMGKQTETLAKLNAPASTNAVASTPNPEVEKALQTVIKRMENMERTLTTQAEATTKPVTQSEPAAPKPQEAKAQPKLPVNSSPAQEVSLQLTAEKPPEVKIPGTLEDLDLLFREQAQVKPISKSLKTFTPEAHGFRDQARDAYVSILRQGTDKAGRIEAYKGLAAMALEDGLEADALLQYKNMIREFPDEAQIYPSRIDAAKLMIDQGIYEPAREQLTFVLDRVPKDARAPEMYFEIARSYAKEGDSEKALSLYRELIRRFPQTAFAKTGIWHKAELLFQLGRFTQARKSYEELTSDKTLNNDFSVRSQLGVGRCLLAEGKPVEAREAFQAVMDGRTKDDQGGEALYGIARTHELEEHPLEAARTYSLAANTYPEHPRMAECRWLAVQNFSALDLHGMAADQCTKLLKDVSLMGTGFRARVEPAFFMAQARAERGRIHFDNARRSIKEFVRRYPNHPLLPMAQIEEAEMLALEKRLPDAIRILERIASTSPEAPIATRALVRKAELEEKMDTPDKVVDTIRRFDGADLDTEVQGDFSLRRALYLLDLHQEDAALSLLRRMVGDPLVTPRHGWIARFQIGVALERQNKIPDAIKAYQQYVEQASTADLKDEDLFKLIESARWKIKTLKNLQNLNRITAQAKGEKP